MNDETREVLLKAAELLGEKGWCQGEAYDNRGRMCAMGALDAAVDVLTYNSYYPAAAVLALHLGIDMPDGATIYHAAGCIPGWNDDPNTTAEDVILAMKRAANSE